MYGPYRVERSRHVTDGSTFTRYALIRTGDGELVTGYDPVLMYRIADALNKEETINKDGANGTGIITTTKASKP